MAKKNKTNQVLHNNSPEIQEILKILGLEGKQIRHFRLDMSWDSLPTIYVEYLPTKKE
jgi:hypothetical protein